MKPIIKWLLGLSMAISSCLLSAIGFTMQRKAHLLELANGRKLRFRLLLIWGVVLYIAAALPDLASYTLVPAVLCSTVGCFRLVVVVALAHCYLHEHVRARELASMAVCTAGTALCVCFGPIRQKNQRPPDHECVLVYVAVGLVMLMLLMLLDRAEELGFRCQGPRFRQLCFFALPLATSLALSLEKIFNTEIGLVQAPKDLPMGVFKHPRWILKCAAIALLGLTDLILNLRGARKMPAQVFIPINFAFFTSLQYFQSVVIFDEYRHMPRYQVALSLVGALASLLGALRIHTTRPALLENGVRTTTDVELLG